MSKTSIKNKPLGLLQNSFIAVKSNLVHLPDICFTSSFNLHKSEELKQLAYKLAGLKVTKSNKAAGIGNLIKHWTMTAHIFWVLYRISF